MARPRVFISSTFYALKQVRADIDNFIKELGYDTVLNEQGNIPYGKDDQLETYCYKEIDNVDILVSIIGGRYGSESTIERHSISQMELNKAYELNKQVYIFIDKAVYNEYKFYLNNKNNPNTVYIYADNVKIYEFIEQIENLPSNNIICGFETSNDITHFLKEQWAGLFKHFLQEQTRNKEINIIKGIENTSKTLNQLVTFLTEEKRDKDKAINEILLSNHPAMEQLKSSLKIPFRVFFTNIEELNDLLSAFSYTNHKDNLVGNDLVWSKEINNKLKTINISKNIFNKDNKLKVFTKEEWNEDFIKIYIEDLIEDLPF